MKTRKEIKVLAREALRAQRGVSIFLGLVYMLLTSVFVAVSEVPVLLVLIRSMSRRRSVGFVSMLGAGAVLWLLLVAGAVILLVLAVNMYGEYLKAYRRETAGVKAMFTELRVHFFRKLGGICWMVLWIKIWALPVLAVPALALLGESFIRRNIWMVFPLILLSLLLLIPMFVKALSYFMTPFILADDPNVKAREALKLSARMTKGCKGQLLVMMLSFIGWGILSALTFGILGIVFVFPYLYLTYAGFYTELRGREAEADEEDAAEIDAEEAAEAEEAVEEEIDEEAEEAEEEAVEIEVIEEDIEEA